MEDTMDRNEFSKVPFQVSRDSRGLRIHVPVKSDRFRALLNLVWLLVWAGVEGAIVLFLLRGVDAPGAVHSLPLPLAGAFLAAFTLAGGIVLWRWLWCVGRRETFHVARKVLLAGRGIWGIERSRRFDLERTRSVNAGRLKVRALHPSWSRMFIGRGESEIAIDCAGRTYTYGKGLEEAEARVLVDLLEEEMGFQFPKPPLRRAKTAFLM